MGKKSENHYNNFRAPVADVLLKREGLGAKGLREGGPNPRVRCGDGRDVVAELPETVLEPRAEEPGVRHQNLSRSMLSILIQFVPPSTLGLRVIKPKRNPVFVTGICRGSGFRVEREDPLRGLSPGSRTAGDCSRSACRRTRCSSPESIEVDAFNSHTVCASLNSRLESDKEKRRSWCSSPEFVV